MDRVDDRTFTLRLKEPFNYVEFLLGGSNGVAGAIMREQRGADRPVHPDQGADRVGAVPFQPRRISARREPGLRPVRRLRSAQGTGQRFRRREGGQGRSRRVGGDPRTRHRLCRDPAGRGGFPGWPDARPAADGGGRSQHRGRRGLADRDLRRAALQSSVSAVQQREGAPGGGARGQPARLHDRGLWRSEILARMLCILGLRQSQRHRGRV